MLSTSNPPARRSCVRHDATSIMANTTPTAPPPYAVGSYNLDAANATTDPDHHPFRTATPPVCFGPLIPPQFNAYAAKGS